MDLYSLTAADVMTQSIQRAETTETLQSAASRMSALSIHCLMIPAATRGGAPGIVTCKDIIRVLSEAPDVSLDELTVGDAMTSPAITIPDYLCLVDCIRIMCMTGLRHAFVLSEREPVGVLSFTDVMRVVADPKQS